MENSTSSSSGFLFRYRDHESPRMMVTRSLPTGGKDIGLNPADCFLHSRLPHQEECEGGRHYESVVFFRYCSSGRSGGEKGFGVHGRTNTRLNHHDDSVAAEQCRPRKRPGSRYTRVRQGLPGQEIENPVKACCLRPYRVAVMNFSNLPY